MPQLCLLKLATIACVGLFFLPLAFADNVRILTVNFWKAATVSDVQQEIENGADLHNLVWHKKSILFVALEHNPNPDVILFLMEQGLDPLKKDGDGYDGLYYLKKNDALKSSNIRQIILDQQESWTSWLKASILPLLIFLAVGYYFWSRHRKNKLEHPDFQK